MGSRGVCVWGNVPADEETTRITLNRILHLFSRVFFCVHKSVSGPAWIHVSYFSRELLNLIANRIH